jgi:CheY-like chemotaxis protein
VLDDADAPEHSTGGATTREERVLAKVPSLAGLRILVVDDDGDASAMMRALLGRFDGEVRCQPSAESALEEVRAWRPDVIVSDIAMPDHDGYWFIAQVRALAPDEGGRTPAVALTALAGAEDRARSLLAGFQQHLRKPVSPSELAAAVASLAGRL